MCDITLIMKKTMILNKVNAKIAKVNFLQKEKFLWLFGVIICPCTNENFLEADHQIQDGNPSNKADGSVCLCVCVHLFTR